MDREDRETKEFFITEEDDGERLDRTLSLFLPQLSRSYIQKIIERDGVILNDERCFSKKQPVRQGDAVELVIPPEQEVKVEAENIPLDIVYEDGDVLVVDKPKGMVVHPGAGNLHGTLVNAVLHHCGDRLSSINGNTRRGIVHRIDKDTSGLLMVAKNDSSHRSLAKQLAERSVTRGYMALTYNNFKNDRGRIDVPVGRDPKMRLRQKAGVAEGREAVTNYTVVERLGNYTLVEARLETGRTHQIRVHLSHIRHPLVGDALYGPAKNPFGVEGQMLHAYLLGFVHPASGTYMKFESPLPQEFCKVLDKLRGK